MTIKSPLPKRLKERRKLKKVSQKNLGILAGISIDSASSRMNQYENGRHPPDFQTAAKIAEQLNVPTCFLYCEGDELAKLILAYQFLDTTERTGLLENAKQRLQKQCPEKLPDLEPPPIAETKAPAKKRKTPAKKSKTPAKKVKVPVKKAKAPAKKSKAPAKKKTTVRKRS